MRGLRSIAFSWWTCPSNFTMVSGTYNILRVQLYHYWAWRTNKQNVNGGPRPIVCITKCCGTASFYHVAPSFCQVSDAWNEETPEILGCVLMGIIGYIKEDGNGKRCSFEPCLTIQLWSKTCVSTNSVKHDALTITWWNMVLWSINKR